jgi:hydroxyacyl-ACP dehydratase HTD2-like protein with hotdog domain
MDSIASPLQPEQTPSWRLPGKTKGPFRVHHQSRTSFHGPLECGDQLTMWQVIQAIQSMERAMFDLIIAFLTAWATMNEMSEHLDVVFFGWGG